MNAVEPIRRLHQHRAWVNENLLAAVATLSDEPLRQPFAIGQGSIWKSLLHIYAAEFVWLETLLGNETACVQGDLPGKLPGNQQGDGGIASFTELRQRWSELQMRWDRYLEQLSADSLHQVVYRVSTSSGAGQRFGMRRMDVLLHVCTHTHYTIAQVMNMLRQCGVEKFPESMLISLARREVGPE